MSGEEQGELFPHVPHWAPKPFKWMRGSVYVWAAHRDYPAPQIYLYTTYNEGRPILYPCGGDGKGWEVSRPSDYYWWSEPVEKPRFPNTDEGVRMRDTIQEEADEAIRRMAKSKEMEREEGTEK